MPVSKGRAILQLLYIVYLHVFGLQLVTDCSLANNDNLACLNTDSFHLSSSILMLNNDGSHGSTTLVRICWDLAYPSSIYDQVIYVA